MEDLINRICQLQSPGGIFLSTVTLPMGEVEDRNCFVTGLVLRELEGVQGNAPLEDAKRKAYAFLLRSQYPSYRYLFSFYPFPFPPFWMRNALFGDADDTSVIVLMLVRAGHLPESALTYVAEEYLLPHRAIGRFRYHIHAPWHREGVFLTWITSRDEANPIDCCVNTNVVALLAAANMQDAEGYEAACDMINEAAQLATRHPTRIRHLTPYYPRVVEWYHALAHAVLQGASALLPALNLLEQHPQVQADLYRTVPLCCDVAGTIIWNAEVLTAARQLRRQYNEGAAQ